MAEEEADTEPDSAFEYKLVGVLIHMGTPQAGHYLSYINVGAREVEGD
jgi:ubiquitin C-terminal hydrolase